jgi:hypothetical protein
MRIAWQRLNGSRIPRIMKVLDPVDVIHVRAGVHASRWGEFTVIGSAT